MSKKWTAKDIPNLTGKVAVVTGGNAGLGRKTSLELARRGAQVVIACRSLDKGKVAAKLWQVSEELTGVRYEGLR